MIALPQRGNVGEDATSTEASWVLSLRDGIDFDGQHFTVTSTSSSSGSSSGASASASASDASSATSAASATKIECAIEAAAEAKWLEPSLLSVRIEVKGTVSAPCARCLKETTLAISDNLMYIYFSRGRDSEKSGAEDEPDDFDDGYMPVEIDYFGRTLDVTPQVWESILLLLPSKVLCREDCAGLCPTCGADLNDGPCGCSADNGDPRFDVLKNFVCE